MANINSLTSNSYSSTSSIYGNRNVLTGLASGMDTETMIQNSVTGYQTKIQELQQSQTKLEWKQDAYRELIDQMYNITNKYTSYTSTTNLSSNSFFTSNRVTTTNGKYADAISATGAATSDIQINAVTQLATATRYAVDASALDVQAASDATGRAIDWSKQTDIGQVSGTMTLKYGSKTIDITFDESDTGINTPEGLKAAIEKKLADVEVTTKKGTVKASDLFKVNLGDNGKTFTFEVDRSNKADDGSAVYINNITGNLAKTLGAAKPSSTLIEDKVKNNGFTVGNFDDLVKKPNMAEYLSGKSVSVTLDGTSKTFQIGDLASQTVKLTVDGEEKTMKLGDLTAEQLDSVKDQVNELLKKDLQASFDKQFGKNRVTVGVEESGGFSFTAAKGSTIKVSSDAGEALGIGKAGVSNYFNTSNTLRDLMGGGETGTAWLDANARLKGAEGALRSQEVYETVTRWYDSDGNLVTQQGLRLDENGDYIYEDKPVKSARVSAETIETTGAADANGVYTDTDGNKWTAATEGEGEAAKTVYYRVDDSGAYIDSEGHKLETATEGEGEAARTVYYRLDDEGNRMTYKANVTSTGTMTGRKESVLKETLYYDSEGNRVDKDGYRITEAGRNLYTLNINGVQVGEFTEDTALESVMTAINSSADAGVNVSYSTLTGQFVFTARETGSTGEINMGEGLAQKLFGVSEAPKNKTLGDVFGDLFTWDKDGNAELTLQSSKIGVGTIGTFNKNDSLQKLIDALDTTAGGAHEGWFKYDADQDKYVMENAMGVALGTRAESILIGDGSSGSVSYAQLAELAKNASTAGADLIKGQDAVIHATVNGKEIRLERSSNVVAMDGMTVTLKDTFNVDDAGNAVKGEAVTFKTSSNADAIVDAIKSFVDDVNKLMTSVHDAYTTQPLTKTSSSSKSGTTYYEPLTEDDKSDMSESAVTKYEEKAKTGLLFGDNDLRALYDKLRTAITSYGSDSVDMKDIGLTTTYSGGVTTISLNETKLREALESNPDKVKNVFTKTVDGGSATNGLIANIKSTLNIYGSTSSGSPGILVSKAGTKHNSVSLLNNNIAKQISNLDAQIESWQTKLSSKIDYYTKQFTQLEKLMSTMNNQSSMLADLMGY